jgi:hypothetical protein
MNLLHASRVSESAYLLINADEIFGTHNHSRTETLQTPKCADGVEREIASSSSVMSAGTSAKSGVLK